MHVIMIIFGLSLCALSAFGTCCFDSGTSSVVVAAGRKLTHHLHVDKLMSPQESTFIDLSSSDTVAGLTLPFVDYSRTS